MNRKEAGDVTSPERSLQRLVRHDGEMEITAESENGSEEGQSRTDGNWWDLCRPIYPKFSDWFRELEECPISFRLTARTCKAQEQLRGWIDQWIERGRPELEWPESDASKAPNYKSNQ